jgi:hypothetical protein
MAEWVAIDEAKKSKWLVIIDYEVYIMDHACCTSIKIMFIQPECTVIS